MHLYKGCKHVDLKLRVHALTNDGEECDGITLTSFLHRAGLQKKERLECIEVRIAGTNGTDEAHWQAFSASKQLWPHRINLQHFNISDIYRRYSPVRSLQLFRCCRSDESESIEEKKAIVPRGNRPLDDSAVKYIKATLRTALEQSHSFRAPRCLSARCGIRCTGFCLYYRLMDRS